MSNLKQSYDAVIVGSGHNGLVAAAYLAKAGKSVLVLEKNNTPGGATASQRIFPDYDALLSRYSYLVSLFPNKIVRDLDLSFTTRRRSTASFTPWTDAAGKEHGLVLSNVDESRSRESMLAMTGSHSSWDQYNEFLGLQSEIAKLIWPSMLQPLRSRESFRSQLANDTARRAWDAFVERPLGESIESYAEHDALRGLLLTDGKIGVLTHAHDPSLLQNRCFLYHVIGNETGEWRVPVGGMKSVVDCLLSRCQQLGVDLVCGADVQHIAAGARHDVTCSITGQEGSNEEVDGKVAVFSAEHVLVNAGPSTLARLCGSPVVTTPEDEGSVVKINMLLKRLPQLKANVPSEEAFAGSFHIDEGYDQMRQSYAAAQASRLPSPAPGEVYCHTLTDNSILSAELQDGGYHTLTLFGLDMPWRTFVDDHDAKRDETLRLYLQGLNNLCSESFEDCIATDSNGGLCIEIKTPQDLQSEIGLDQGNIFHNALSWFYGADDEAGSWGVETEFPRIYRAGSSALRGGAVSGIPGHNAAMKILSDN